MKVFKLLYVGLNRLGPTFTLSSSLVVASSSSFGVDLILLSSEVWLEMNILDRAKFGHPAGVASLPFATFLLLHRGFCIVPLAR